jgi:hypothetical protein
MKPEDQPPYEPDKRSGVQPGTVRKLAKALNVHPREILLEGGQ